ncbi:alginate lyase family protein [Paenibacillus chitinolyticus]|uniref:alginate lyase family protein n=1 Tax=Paenibacillus chitinolyticus TaxID=79263 RepID=UPI001C468AFE|nr:alginate lyase family protein [Paenibacillus chitinolyticus]MBV6713475.1 heparinase II/III family protein [Paenibacillus chitinolyticus]
MRNQLRMMQNMGLGWTLFRIKYELKKRAGFLEKEFPAVSMTEEEFLKRWSSHAASPDQVVREWRAQARPFFFHPDKLNGLKPILQKTLGASEQELLNQADRICEGTFTYFSRWNVHQGTPNWHWNPITNEESPRDLHWSKIPDLSGAFGDIKYIWELSRFSFAYTLVRAYALTGSSLYPETFWNLFEDWVKNNPEERGVNYKCCQEMSLRVMAWIFALYAFANHSSSTDKRMFSLLKQVYCHTDHIDKHFDFALKSVKNNHTISEAAGLYTVGLLFPFFDRSGRWKKKGFRHLEAEGMWQIYEDGSYLQHSMNYHRLVVQDYTWALRLAELNGEAFSNKLKERLYKTFDFLYQFQDEATGRLPNYGMNDGALIHPLSHCEYLDYRPQLGAFYFILTGKRLYPDGPHEESLVWLAGESASSAPRDSFPRAALKAYPEGGYYSIRMDGGSAMIRCGTYRHRPAQADMLHLDIWREGTNVICDAGTYSYNTDAEWSAYFMGTASHNTVMIGDDDQMEKGSRFIWYNWTKSHTRRAEAAADGMTLFEGEHYGYGPLIHRRAVIQSDAVIAVIDEIAGDFNGTERAISASWLSAARGAKATGEKGLIELETPAGPYFIETLDTQSSTFRIYHGDEKARRGWRSLYYGEKEPAYQIVRSLRSGKPVRLVTVLSPVAGQVTYDPGQNLLRIQERSLRLNPVGTGAILSQEKVTL